MRIFKKVDDTWCIQETTRLFGLTLTEQGKITAPEGKQVTLVYNGENLPLLPGQYEGDVVLEVTDTLKYQDLDFRAAVVLENGKYVPEKSAASAAVGGTVTDGKVSGVSITSMEETVTGIFTSVPQGGETVIENVTLNMVGNGGSDFAGWGSAITGAGQGKLVVNDSRITTHGAARCAIYAGENVELEVNDTKIDSRGGVLPGDYEDTIKTTPPGVMRRVPWQLGLRGNCRATNLLDYANATYNRCELSADGWGVLSTDGVKKCRMQVNDSKIKMTGEGYGALTIGDCVVTLDNSAVTSPGYGMVLLMGDGSARFQNGTTVEAGRFVTMSDMNTGYLEVEDSHLHSKETAFVVKGSSTEFRLKNTTITADNGIILQAMVTDDPVMPTGYYIDPAEDDVYEAGRDLFTATPKTDVVATFTDMTLRGDMFNGTSSLTGDTGMPPMGALGGDMPEMPAGMPPMPEGGFPGGGMPPMPTGDTPGAPADGAPGDPPGGGFFSSTPMKNLGIHFQNTEFTGVISASVARHRVPKVTKENCEELGMVINTPTPVVNNGVIVTLDEKTTWTVTGDCYLSSLTLAEGAKILGAEGKKLSLTVDGRETALVSGSYTGAIQLSLS